MTDKFGRNYVLDIQTADGSTLTVTLPFTIEFDITRNTLSSANVCQVRIYNLNALHRNQIRFNAYDYGTHRSIRLRAGYGNDLATIFTGNYTQAWSVREGVNFISQIECYDGGFAFGNGVTNAQFPAGTPMRNMLTTVARQGLPFVALGAVGNYPGTLQRGIAVSGNTANVLTQYSGGGFFIDGGKANILQTAEYIQTPSGVLVINTASGLLGTPIRENNLVRFDMLFEPALNVGVAIRLESSTENNFNGQYKVTAVKHRGMISEAVCGSVITTGEFLFLKNSTAVPAA